MPGSGDEREDDDSVKGPWKEQEDKQLMELISRHGTGNWSVIARELPGRNGKSCRLRWFNQLSPLLKREPFSTNEDALIIQAHGQYGNRWSLIAKLIPGRTDNAVKNRWNSTLKRKMHMRNILDRNFRRTLNGEEVPDSFSHGVSYQQLTTEMTQLVHVLQTVMVEFTMGNPCITQESIDSGSLSFLCNIMTQQLTKAYQVITGQADPHGVSLTEEYTQHSLPTDSDLQLAGLASQPSLEPDDDFMLPDDREGFDMDPEQAISALQTPSSQPLTFEEPGIEGLPDPDAEAEAEGDAEMGLAEIPEGQHVLSEDVVEHFEGTLLQAMQASSLQDTPRSTFTNSLASSYDSLGSHQTRTALQRGARHPALAGYESMMQPLNLTVETRSASLNRHPATRRLFFEPDMPVQLGPEQLPTTALQLQVQQQLDSLREEEAEAEQARTTGALRIPTSGSPPEMLDSLLPPDVLEGMRDAHEEELRLAAEEMGCLESLENLHIPAQDALAPIHHEIFEEDLDTHLQFSSLLQHLASGGMNSELQLSDLDLPPSEPEPTQPSNTSGP